MFNVGISEFMFIVILALVLIGPKQMPQIARSIGRLVGEFKKATGDLTQAFFEAQKNVEREVDKVNKHVKDTEKEITKEMAEALKASAEKKSDANAIEEIKKT